MSDVIDRDVKGLLAAWGAWANENHDTLGCKSPSLMLIKQAPHKCQSDDIKTRPQAAYISDDDALKVERAMAQLSRYSVHLYAILTLHYRYRWSIKRIADDYWSQFEYPCGKKKATNYHVNPLFFEGIGFIGRALMVDNA